MTIYDLADVARVTWQRARRWVLWSPVRLFGVAAVVVVVVLGYAAVAIDGNPGARDDLIETSSMPEGWEQWPVVDVPAADEPSDETDASDATAADQTGDEEETSGTEDTDEEHTGQDAHAEPDEDDRAAAAKAAFKFAAAYVDVDRSTKKWRKDVDRYTIEQLADALDSVDPANVGPYKLRGDVDKTTEIKALGTYGGVVAVDTDPGPLLLNLTRDGNEWVVSRVTPPQRSGG